LHRLDGHTRDAELDFVAEIPDADTRTGRDDFARDGLPVRAEYRNHLLERERRPCGRNRDRGVLGEIRGRLTANVTVNVEKAELRIERNVQLRRHLCALKTTIQAVVSRADPPCPGGRDARIHLVGTVRDEQPLESLCAVRGEGSVGEGNAGFQAEFRERAYGECDPKRV
jgi:hypothetical protein